MEEDSLVTEKDGKVDAGEEESEWVEFDAEFKPIEHPKEPLEEDRPVKCPMPDSSLLHEGGKHIVKEEASALEEDEESIELQADRKRRHHRIHQHQSSMQPPVWGSQYNIFQALFGPAVLAEEAADRKSYCLKLFLVLFGKLNCLVAAV